MARRPTSVLAPLLLIAAASGLAGCGDDGPTTTSAKVPPALAAQGERGTTAPTPPAPPGALSGYVDGGRAASGTDAAAVRRDFRAFAQAVIDRDAAAACARVTGFEELLRSRGQSGDCRTLLPAIGNSAAGPSPKDLRQIDDADVTIGGDRATISLGSEAPVPLRRLDGVWKLDYAALAATSRGG